MERRLIVMRHAKSSWKSSAPTDHERPLNKRGRRDAPRVAERLSEMGWIPEQVLSSDSERTRETWTLMKKAFDPRPGVTFLGALYLAGPDEVEEEAAELGTEVGTALVLGHNPGWEDVVSWLCGEEVRLTTANAALLLGEGQTWRDALSTAPGWRLQAVIRPKEL